MSLIPKINLSTVITKMTKADALEPIVALEATVVTGRTYQAHKRGGWDEARERALEESTGSVVWLCGVQSLNKLGDKILSKILKSKGQNFDVGTDKILRTPFDNFMKEVAPKGFSKTSVALLKGTKVLTSVVLTNLFIGFVVPKLNQGLTKKIRHERQSQNKLQNGMQNNAPKNRQPSFKGGAMLGGINKFTNWIENTNTGKLLSSDAGIAGGRMYNARRKEERREIAIRDIGSIYFYMWAQGHVRNVLNFVETGHATRLNPATAGILNEKLTSFIGNKKMSVEEFRKAVLGKEIKLPDNIKFETAKPSVWDKLTRNKPLEVVRLSELEKKINNPEIIARAREMSKLQPQRRGASVLTKQQVIDSYNKAEINNPELLDSVFHDFSGGAHKEEFRYISNKKLYKLKTEMEHYVDTICKAAKDGKVDKNLLNKVRKKNLMYSGINFAAGFVFAAAFLSTFIPKIQYYITRKTTGVDAFPGVYDYEKHQEEID